MVDSEKVVESVVWCSDGPVCAGLWIGPGANNLVSDCPSQLKIKCFQIKSSFRSFGRTSRYMSVRVGNLKLSRGSRFVKICVH